MTPSPNLPPRCILRPAQVGDRSDIDRLLFRLQREMMPVDARFQALGGALSMGLLGMGVVLAGLQFMMQILWGLLFLLPTLWLITRFLKLGNEWSNFWVIEQDGMLIACAKLCRFNNYSVLFDLFVMPEWRRQGLGSHLVRHLGQQATKPLYLACRPAIIPFYTRLGFALIPAKKLPPFVQHDLGVPGQFGIVPMVLV